MAEIYYIQVIRKCNQNCRFCSNPSNGKNITLKDLKKLIDFYAKEKAAAVIFSGGEPTLYKYLPQAIKYAASLGLNPRITTNGQKSSDISYLRQLSDAGLRHIHFSLYSHKKDVHEYLTRTPGSYDKIIKAIGNAHRLGIHTDLNTVINRLNSKHLHLMVQFIMREFSFIRHIVFNNMDPGMNRAIEDMSTVPVFSEFEASLAMAMRALNDSGRTFRVERVPLCFMSEFPHYSTETRKIIKHEDRQTFFLDEKEMVRQNKWTHGYGKRCAFCGVKSICAGLFRPDVYYTTEELCPVFYDIEKVRKSVLRQK